MAGQGAIMRAFFEGIGIKLDRIRFNLDPAALQEWLRSSPLFKVNPENLQGTIKLLENPPPLFRNHILPDSMAISTTQSAGPGEALEPETAKRAPAEPISEREHPRGPVAGQAYRETAERRALVPLLRKKRLVGEDGRKEGYRPAIRRLLQQGELKDEQIPGSSALDERINLLARVWGEEDRREGRR